MGVGGGGGEDGGTVMFCSSAPRLNFKLVPLLLPTLCPLGLMFLYIYILGHSCGYMYIIVGIYRVFI